MTEEQKWQDWQPEDADLDRLLKKRSLSRISASHPLLKLKKALLLNIIWGLLILLFYLAIMIILPVWPILLTLLVTSIFSLYFIVKAVKLYRSIQSYVSANRPMLEELRMHHSEIESWGKLQQKLGLFVYPFAIAGGYLSGGILGSGKTIEELLQRPVFLYTLPVTAIVLIPLCYWLTKWMFRKAFGKHLQALGGLIQSLEQDN